MAAARGLLLSAAVPCADGGWAAYLRTFKVAVMLERMRS